MKCHPLRLLAGLMIGTVALVLFACQTTTIKKIFVNDEPLFEYPHIVESDRIWIEDDPEVFYAFVRNLKDFLYEDAEHARLFVKRGASVFMLWLIPIQQGESTIYELRIEEPMLAYGEAVAGGGWIKQSFKFPFPVYLLDGVSSNVPGILPVAFDPLVAFYGHVKTARINPTLEWIEIDVGSAIVILQKQADEMTIRFVEDVVSNETAGVIKAMDFSVYVLENAKRMDGVTDGVPAYVEIQADESALMIQLLLFQSAVKWDAATYASPRIAMHQIEWRNGEDRLILQFYRFEQGVFATLTYQAQNQTEVSLTVIDQSVSSILDAIEALLQDPVE